MDLRLSLDIFKKEESTASAGNQTLYRPAHANEIK
jgi:hypothetical protein